MKLKNKIKYLLLATTLVISGVLSVGCQSQKDIVKTQNKEEQNKEKETMDNNSNTSATKDKYSNKDKTKSETNSKKTDLKEITYYTYDINTEKLTPHTKMVDEISVGNIMKELSSNGIIPNDSRVKTAKVENVDGIRTLIVDVNDAFINFDQGSSAETLSLQAFTNSMIKSFKVEQVKLTVEGNNYSSGHIALKDNQYLKFK